MLEDVRGVERCCDVHHKPVGVRNQSSFPRRKRRHAAINHLLDNFSRRTEVTVGLVGWLRIVCRAQGISEKLKTVLS